MRSVPLSLSLLLSCLCISALATSSSEQEINDLYRRGLQGDKAAVEQCITRLEETLRDEPKNELARVYLGSAYTLRSRDLGYGRKKLQALRQGLRVMDEAVVNAPDDPKVRLGRALTTQALPSFFGRARESRSDFLQLAQMAEANTGQLNGGDLQIVYYNAGLAAKAAGDRTRAAFYWRKALTHPVDRTLAQKCLDALTALK